MSRGDRPNSARSCWFDWHHHAVRGRPPAAPNGPAPRAASRRSRSRSWRAARGREPVQMPGRPRCAVRLGEHPPLHVDRLERCALGQQRLRLAQEKYARGRQREMEARQNPRLGLGVEVHQAVAADQQVHPGDRRVLDQVVAAEDHRAPQLLVEDVPIVLALEVLLQQRRRDVLDRAAVVDRLPGLVAPPRRRRWRRS